MENINNFLASLHYLNHFSLSGLSAIIVFLLGFFVLSKDKKSKIYRAFFFFTFSLGIWFLGNALSMFYYKNFELSVFLWKLAYSGAVFFTPIYYNFYFSIKKKKNINLIPFLLVIAVLELLYMWIFGNAEGGGYTVQHVGLVWKEITPFSYFLIFGMIKYVAITTLIVFFFWQEKKEAREEKNTFLEMQFKWLSFIFFCAFFGFIEWLPIFNIQLHVAWFTMPVFIGMTAYAILKHRLMDINVIIKKAFFYSIGIALVSGAIVAISFLSNWFAEKIPGLQSWVIPLMAGTTAFVVGNLFWRKSKEAEKLKYEFITVATHKLRSPLTKIKWALEVLKNETTEEGKSIIKRISISNEQTIELINGLLNLSRAESGYYQYKIELTDFKEVAQKTIDNVAKDFSIQIKKRNIKIDIELDDNLPKIKFDNDRIGSVIQMLLENTISYTKDQVWIKLKKENEYLRFSIKDNGIGVSEGDQKYIFSRFFRTHKAYLIETEGSGLSLYLSKNIIEKHDGEIGVISKGEGQGSEFWFKLKI